MKDRILDVLIIGAGPAGGALGYLLASRGLTVTVVEKAKDFHRQFRGEGLQPSGLTCIEQMGLSEAFNAVPKHHFEMMRIHIEGKTYEFAGDGAVKIVNQPAMLDMFAAEAARFEGFTLLRGCSFEQLLREDGRVVGARVKDKAAGEQELRARLVVGCDGRSSRAKRQSGLESVSLNQRFDVLWLKAELGDFFPDTHTGWWELAGQHSVLVYPSPAGKHQIGVVLAKGEARELPRSERLDWVISLVSEPLREALQPARDSVDGPAVLKVICERLETWTTPGLLLLGDAAHAMSPVGGQGINMALRDAVVAANHLVPALQRGVSDGELDLAAAAVAAERLPEVAEVQSLQTKEGKRMEKPQLWLLRWLLPLMRRLGISPARMNRRRARMAAGLVEVKLAV